MPKTEKSIPKNPKKPESILANLGCRYSGEQTSTPSSKNNHENMLRVEFL